MTCETIERSQVCIIDKTAYWTLVRRNSELAVKLIQLLAGELDADLDQLDQFTFKTARQRLASLLLDLAERFGRRVSDQVRIEITLKREELAELAGVTIETAIRLLNAFREEGLITVQGRQITINDAERLGRVARC
ncbi:Crp/Fnr family transcriptional regulator [Nitrospira sp. Kam-Ns4a]